MPTYPCAHLDAKGVPRCTDRCPDAIRSGLTPDALRCGRNGALVHDRGICYAWALDKISEDDAFPLAGETS